MSRCYITAKAKANVIKSVLSELVVPPADTQMHKGFAIICILNCTDTHTFHGCPSSKLLFNLN